MGFEIEHPHRDLALSYKFTFMVQTQHNNTFFIRLTFPFLIHTSDPYSQIKAEFYDNLNCADNLKENPPLYYYESFSYYFKIKSFLQPQSFYTMKIITKSLQSLSDFIFIYPPIEISTVLNYSNNSLVIDQNPSFQNIELKVLPPKTLKLSYVITNSAEKYYLIEATYSIIVDITPSMTISTNAKYKLFFENYQFEFRSCGFPSPSNNPTLAYGSCSISNDNKIAFITLKNTIVASESFKIPVVIKNPAEIDTVDQMICFFYSGENNIIYESGSTDKSFSTSKLPLIQEQKVFLANNMDISIFEANLTALHYGYKFSEKIAYNAIKFSFTVNTQISVRNMGVVIQLNYLETEIILLIGSYTHNMPSQSSLEKVICLPKSDTLSNISLYCYNVGSLEKDVAYFISFKIAFTQVADKKIPGTISLFYKTETGIKYFSLPSNYSTELRLRSNTEYNSQLNLLEAASYNYILSTLKNDFSITENLNDLTTNRKNIGVFKSNELQTLLFLISPKKSDWCTTPCDLIKSGLYLDIYLGKVFDSTYGLLAKFPDMIIQPNLEIDNSDENYNYIKIECNKTSYCFSLLGTDDAVATAFGMKNFYIKNFNSLYADSFLADVVFSLGYLLGEVGKNPVSYFLYNGYIINSAYNSNVKLSMINYPFNVLYDSSQFPVMIGLKLIIGSEMTSTNNLLKNIQLFFDSNLENFSLNNYSVTKNESLFYEIGCSSYPSYGSITCNSFKTDIDNRDDSFVQMNRIEINIEKGVPILKEITIYIPVKIAKIGIPYSFYISFLDNDNTFLNIYRIFGSSLNKESLISTTLKSPVSETLIYSNLLNYPKFSIKEDLNSQLAYGLQKKNGELFAGNTISNLEIKSGNDNVYFKAFINPNDVTNQLIGAGFTITSKFDLFSGKKITFSGNDMQCVSFLFNSNKASKYVVFCPFEKNIEIDNLNVIVDTFIVPLQWYLNYNFGTCDLVYAWSSNKGQLISKQCEDYLIENTNDILTIAKSNTYLSKNKATHFLEFNLISNINLTEIAKIKIELKITSNFEILSYNLNNQNKCYMTDGINNYEATYYIDPSHQVIILNNLIGESTSFPIGNYTFLLENIDTTNLNVSSFNISVSLFYINFDSPIMKSKINMLIPINNDDPFSIKVNSVDFYFKNSLMTILSINSTFIDYVGESTKYFVSFQNLTINNEFKCLVYSTTKGRIYDKIGNFFYSSTQMNFSLNQPNYYDKRNLLIVCSGIYFSNLNEVNTTSIQIGIIKKNIMIKSDIYSFTQSNNESFYSCLNEYLIEKKFIYPGLPSYYKLTLKPSNPKIEKLSNGSFIYIVFFRSLPINLNKRGKFSCYINNLKQKCYTDEKFIILSIFNDIQMTTQKSFIVEIYDVDQTLAYQNSKVWVGISLTDPKVITEQCLINEINENIGFPLLFIDVLLLNVMNNTFGGSSKLEIYFKLINSTLEGKSLVVKFPDDFTLDSNLIETKKVLLMESTIQKNIIKGMNVLGRNLIISFDNSVFPITSQIKIKSFILIIESFILPWHITYLCFQQQISIYLQNDLSQITSASLDFLNFNKVNFLSCHIECLTCKNSSSNGCLSCDNNTFLFDSKCLKSCPNNLKEDQRNRICRECHYSCKSCTDKTDKDCYECGESRTLKILNNSTLIGQCECNKSFNDIACHNNCATCSGVAANNCNSCYDSFLLTDEKECQCPENYYQTLEIKCAKCSNIKCKTCSNLNSSICNSCLQNYIVSPAGDCMCPSNTSDMGYLPKCYDIKNKNCHYTCLTCIGEKSDQCISCDETKDFVNYTCVCKKGYFEEFSSKQCKKCWRTCNSCKGLMSNDCTSCITNHYLANDNSCVCPSNYFDLDRLDTCMGLFQSCHKSCSKCIGIEINECSQCKENRTFKLGLCPCAKGYFENSTSDCQECHFRCSDCNSPDNLNCTACSGNHSKIQLSDGSAKVCSCPENFSDIGLRKNCFPLINNSFCDKSCGTCIGPLSNECASCNSTTRFFDKGLCRCYTGFFETQEHNCSDCHYSCLNCSGYKQNECSFCKANRGDKNNMPINGLCKCRDDFSDTFVAECKLSPLVTHLKAAETALLSTMASTLFPFFVIGAFGIIWKLIESVQLLSHMLYINVDLPPNYDDFLEKIYTFNLNTLVPNPIEDFLADDNAKIFQKYTIEDQVPPLKFEVRKLTSLFIHNAFIIMIIQGVVWLIYLYLILHERKIMNDRDKNKNEGKIERKISKGRETPKNEKKSIITKAKEIFEWFIILQVIQSFELQLYLFIALQFNNPSFINFFNFLGFIASLLALIYSFYWIGKIFLACFLPIKTDSEMFMRKFKYLFELVKIEKYLQRNYFIINTIRKLLLAWILVFCQNAVIQISLLIILYSNMFLYVGWIKPFKHRIKNIIEFLNEFLIACLHVFCLIYFVMNLSNEEKDIFGWVMIGILILNLLINFFGVLIELAQNIRKIWKAMKNLNLFIKMHLFRMPNPNEELEEGTGYESSQKGNFQKEKDLSALRNLQDDSDRPSFIQNQIESDNYFERKASESKEKKNNSIKDIKYEEKEKRKIIMGKGFSPDLKNFSSLTNSPNDEFNKDNQTFDRRKLRRSDSNLFHQIRSFINKKNSPKTFATSIQHIHLEEKNEEKSNKNHVQNQSFELQPQLKMNLDLNNKLKNRFATPLKFQRTEDLLSSKDNETPINCKKMHKNKFPEKIPKEARHLYNLFVYKKEDVMENEEKSILSEGNIANENGKHDEEVFTNYTVPNFGVVSESEERENKKAKHKKKNETFSKSSFAYGKNNLEEAEPYNNEILNIIDEIDDEEELDVVQEKKLASQKRATKMSRFINSIPSKKDSRFISTRSLQGTELKSFVKELDKKENYKAYLKPEKKVVKKKEEYIPFEPTREEIEIVSIKKRIKKKSSSNQKKPSSLSNYFLDNYKKNIDDYKIHAIVFKRIDAIGVVLQDIWSAGLDFFFLTEGESVNIVEINEINKWAKVKKDDKIGLFHLEDFFLR